MGAGRVPCYVFRFGRVLRVPLEAVALQAIAFPLCLRPLSIPNSASLGWLLVR